jgi:hypothetical protein
MSDQPAEAQPIDAVAVAEVEAVRDEPKPKTREQKADLVDAVKAAKDAHAVATEALAAARVAGAQALQDQARALDALKAARKELAKETEGTP